MVDIHCHRCGGFIGNPEGTTYREASAETPQVMVPHTGMCMCDNSVVYGQMPEVHTLRSASRN
jgi:hypothetical protein